jgi:hypothetical protein
MTNQTATKPSAKKPTKSNTRWATCSCCGDVFDRYAAAEERDIPMAQIPAKLCPMCGMY